MVEVPRTTRETTPAFLTEALRSAGVLPAGVEVAEVHHDEIGVGVGIVGQLARLGLRYSGEATGMPGSMVLKLPTQVPENRLVGDLFNFYEREGRFYEELRGKLTVRTPEVYWNLIDPETGTFGLLLEDLSHATMISQVAGLPPGRAAQAVQALAQVHARWWEAPALDGLGWMPRLDDPVNLAAGEHYRNAWPAFVDYTQGALDADALALGERVQEVFEDLLRQVVAEAPVTLCHGDFRADNLLFDDRVGGTDGVAVLDWQMSYRGPAITDLAYLLCQSLTVEDRRAHEAELVRQWYDAVAEATGGTGGQAQRALQDDGASASSPGVDGCGAQPHGSTGGQAQRALQDDGASASSPGVDGCGAQPHGSTGGQAQRALQDDGASASSPGVDGCGAQPHGDTEAQAQRAIDGYPFELAWDQYRRAALGTTVYPVAMGAMDLANERGNELGRARAVRSFTAAVDLGGLELL
jgi:hypothetical protein